VWIHIELLEALVLGGNMPDTHGKVRDIEVFQDQDSLARSPAGLGD